MLRDILNEIVCMLLLLHHAHKSINFVWISNKDLVTMAMDHGMCIHVTGEGYYAVILDISL